MASSLLLLFVVIATCKCVDCSVFYTTNDQEQSIPLGTIDKRVREEFQQAFLSILGLAKMPEPKRNDEMDNSATKFMKDVYNIVEGSVSREHTNEALGINSSRINADEIIAYMNNAKTAGNQQHDHGRSLYFDVQTEENIIAAEVRIFKEVPQTFKTGILSFQLYFVTDKIDTRVNPHNLLSSIDVEYNTTKWLVLEATKAARFWAIDPYLNMGLYLRVVDAQGNILTPQDINGTESVDKQPFLVIYKNRSADRSQHRRFKRWADNVGPQQLPSFCSGQLRTDTAESINGSNKCQKRDLYINLRDIGFGPKFLIAPEVVPINYCAGECSFPLSKHMNAINRAKMLSLAHIKFRKPSCVPNLFRAIPIMYFDETGAVKVKNLSRMTVMTCGCVWPLFY